MDKNSLNQIEPTQSVYFWGIKVEEFLVSQQLIFSFWDKG